MAMRKPVFRDPRKEHALYDGFESRTFSDSWAVGDVDLCSLIARLEGLVNLKASSTQRSTNHLKKDVEDHTSFGFSRFSFHL